MRAMSLVTGHDLAVSAPGPRPPTRGRGLAVLAVLMVLSAVMIVLSGKPPGAATGDSPSYLDAAYHLRHEGTFTEADRSSPAPPALGREPGYATFLALLMAIDPGLARFRPECLADGGPCPPDMVRSVSLANLALIELAGLNLFFLARRVTGRTWAGLVGAAYILFNVHMNKYWYEVQSDWLALWLVSLALLALALAWERPAVWRWSLLGLVFGALSLTKAVFVFLCCPAAALALLWAVRRASRRRAILVALAAAAVTYAALVGGWMARNAAVSGSFRLTDARGGIALSTREVFDHMTGAQYLAAFVYWTHGPGPALARRLFAPATVDPFDLDTPGGFYDTGQNGYGRRVSAVMAATGATWWDATAVVDRDIVRSIREHPVAHALSTLPILYRGLWIDQFALAGVPLFAWMWIRAIRRRQALIIALLSVGVFNGIFYALFSLDIPRYQMTAVPSVALGVALAAPRVRAWLASRLRPSRLAQSVITSAQNVP